MYDWVGGDRIWAWSFDSGSITLESGSNTVQFLGREKVVKVKRFMMESTKCQWMATVYYEVAKYKGRACEPQGSTNEGGTDHGGPGWPSSSSSDEQSLDACES